MWPPTPSPRALARLTIDGGVPEDERLDAPFDLLVAGELGLVGTSDGVHVGRDDAGREPEVVLGGAVEQPGENLPGAVPRRGSPMSGVEGVDPLPGQDLVLVGELAGGSSTATHDPQECGYALPAAAAEGGCAEARRPAAGARRRGS